MKAEHVKTSETMEKVSSYGVEKRAESIDVNEDLPLPEKNGGWTGNVTCKSMEQEENQEEGPHWSWARNQMRNIK
jgi:hypothetical protein